MSNILEFSTFCPNSTFRHYIKITVWTTACNPVEIFLKIKQHGCIPQQRSLWVPKNATNTCWFAGVLFYKDTKH